jgi:DNA-binding transcriptional MocR family regulator
VLRTVGPRALGYGAREGLPRLREAVAADLARQGVPAGADDLVITSGSQQALDLVVRALANPGEPVLVEEATYTGALNVIAAAGARAIGVPSDEQGPSLDALERLGRSGAKALYLMPNCHNPTGGTISAARREALVSWSHRAGVPIIEDDYVADLEISGVPAPAPMRSLDGDVIYIGTFSKRLIPALRTGFVVCPAPLRPRLVALKYAVDLGNSDLVQHALAEFLERGYLIAHLAKTLPRIPPSARRARGGAVAARAALAALAARRARGGDVAAAARRARPAAGLRGGLRQGGARQPQHLEQRGGSDAGAACASRSAPSRSNASSRGRAGSRGPSTRSKGRRNGTADMGGVGAI